MNIPSKLDILHGFYGKARYAFLIIFSCSVIVLSLISHSAYGESVVGSVATKLAVKIDGKTQNITTTQNNIDAALKQNGVNLDKNDITEPPLSTYLGGKTINVTVVRAIPVLITDGGQSWAGKSAYTQPIDILKQLVVEVFPEDRIAANLILDPAAVGMAGQNITINRAPVYTIYVDDKTIVARSWTSNISDLLAEKGISLGANDIVEPTKTSVLVGVTEITVTRINYADIEETVAIPYKTINQNDYNMYQGKSAVTQEGANGSKKQSLHIVYKNGIEVERTVTSTEVVLSVQNKIVAIGVKPYSHEDLWNIMVAASAKYGNVITPLDLYKVGDCESHLNAGSIGSGKYYGLFQYNLGLWQTASSDAGFAGSPWSDPTAQIYATARYASTKGWGPWSCRP